MGYPDVLTYLRATPRNDGEKRDAVNKFVMGLTLCALGILFNPFVIVGAIYLYYGGRKIGYVLLELDRSMTKEGHADQSDAAK
jgi:hypothetical protein